jgi:hypothetical protein
VNSSAINPVNPAGASFKLLQTRYCSSSKCHAPFEL